jgi:RNA polymerase sigma factor (sigma-70 family)
MPADGPTEALVRAAQGGDTIAMNDLLDLLAPYVGRICGPIALEHGPDAAQEALTAVFRHLHTLREPAALRGWVRRIATRGAVRVTRRAADPSGPQAGRAFAAAVEVADLPAPGHPSLAADVRDVLSRLSPEHRAVLVLRDLEGLDEREAAALLSVPEGTVKFRLHRARSNFRKAWTR